MGSTPALLCVYGFGFDTRGSGLFLICHQKRKEKQATMRADVGAAPRGERGSGRRRKKTSGSQACQSGPRKQPDKGVSRRREVASKCHFSSHKGETGQDRPCCKSDIHEGQRERKGGGRKRPELHHSPGAAAAQDRGAALGEKGPCPSRAFPSTPSIPGWKGPGKSVAQCIRSVAAEAASPHAPRRRLTQRETGAVHAPRCASSHGLSPGGAALPSGLFASAPC